MSDPRVWQICVDTGGTFTDCLAIDPDGRTHRAKVLSTSALRGRSIKQLAPNRISVQQNWDACDDFVAGLDFQLLGREAGKQRITAFDAKRSLIELASSLPLADIAGATFQVQSDEPAPILAARLLTGTVPGRPLPPINMRLATTRGTNALLERRGAEVALFITRGFGDLLSIGNQQRPDLFALRIIKPPPLPAHTVEIDERLCHDGSILVPLDLEQVRRQAARLIENGVRVAAVALMHSYVNPQHERQVAALLREIGFMHVSCSSDRAPLIRLLPRTQTAVVDAYLAPVIEDYLRQIAQRSGRNHRLHVMTSAGGLSRADEFRACDSLLSGPAGGVAGAAAAGKASGFDRLIGFDMGGTSTDVARYDGDFDYRFEHSVADVQLLAPALAIETVAAGGGSICDVRNGAIAVGPQSAGADPGPACYGGAGNAFLTLTDVNLLLGRLDERQFEIPLSRAAAEQALARVLEKGQLQLQESAALLEGFLDIANERMAAAIERVSIRQGYDPKDYVLVAFGGAGGQHACAVADRLGMNTILVPQDASLLSAAGLAAAVIERVAQRQILRRLDEVADQIGRILLEIENEAATALANEGVLAAEVIIRRRIVNLRLLGQDFALPIELADSDLKAGGLAQKLARDFQARYIAIYAHAPPLQRKPIEVESVRVMASGAGRSAIADNGGTGIPGGTGVPPVRVSGTGRTPVPQHVRARFAGEWREVHAFARAALPINLAIDGPALVFERRSTIVIEAGWRATVDQGGAIVLRRQTVAARSNRIHPELIELELFINRLTSIAADMGQMLQRTALSTNVKERLDFSCAVLDAQGALVVNAPHIPVHLGALGECVRSVRQAIAMNDGDVIVTNHPAFGGSHLPDVTVITPVFGDDDGLIGYVASRAHHAEIGGIAPGSMPPAATRLSQEGVVITPRYLIHQGAARFDEMEQLLRAGPWPSRAAEDNLADLRAAVAANHRGAQSLRQLAQATGGGMLAARMRGIRARAQKAAGEALARLARKRYEAIEYLDDGSPIRVTIDLTAERAAIDFAGSAPQHSGNLNATPAIVRSAVIYVLRLLMGDAAAELPLNEGILDVVDLRIPPASMLDPRFVDDPDQCPAVVGGNVETSQRIVDTLLKALEVCACSQGTMNNVLFGNENFGYYETICGGAGAGPAFGGADAVHTHMTNTRITDPELIEHRYGRAVRVERFAIRRGSGGSAHPPNMRGGDGAVREFTFLAPLSLSILSQHRVQRPYGLHGGGAGACGRQKVIRASGEVIELASIDHCQVEPGDRLIVETPGGGGYGQR